MGQKVHPESIRVGYIHDWKSNWFNEKNFSDYLHEDTQIRAHIIGGPSPARPSGITIRNNTTAGAADPAPHIGGPSPPPGRPNTRPQKPPAGRETTPPGRGGNGPRLLCPRI